MPIMNDILVLEPDDMVFTPQEDLSDHSHSSSSGSLEAIAEGSISTLDLANVTVVKPAPRDSTTSTSSNSSVTTATTSSATTATSSSPHEFSLSSLTNVLQESATNFGSVTASLWQEAAQSKRVEKIRASFSHIGSPAKQKTNDSSPAKKPTLALVKQRLEQETSYRYSYTPRQQVQFGRFDRAAQRLRYSPDDVYAIIDDPEQFAELQHALKSLGAVTNHIVQQKMHWYIKNSKKERLRRLREQEQLRQQQQDEEKEEDIQQQQEEEEISFVDSSSNMEVPHPVTPPNQSPAIDSTKVLEAAAEGIRASLSSDSKESPKSVRSIYRPNDDA